MHPILIQITDDFFIGTYGVLIALGLAAALAVASWLGKRRGIVTDVFYDLGFVAILSGFLGARLLYILTDFRGFMADPMPYIFSRTGFVFLGGLIAAAAACTVYVRRKGIDFWNAADIVMVVLPIGHAFGRIGCHLAGCCFGGVCPAPMGIKVPAQTLPDGNLWPNAFSDHLERGLLQPGAMVSLPVHPVQIYEAGGLLLLSAGLAWLALRPHSRGLLFGLYLVGYGVLRFGLEFLRGDEVRGLYFGGLLSTSQLLSLGLIAAGAVVLATMRQRGLWKSA
jgi:phosphatidylglycerol:prolipoprotein diacylglycerol transferase